MNFQTKITIPHENVVLGNDFAPLMPALERRRLQCYAALILGDMLCLIGGYYLGGYVYRGMQGVSHSLVFGQLMLPAMITIALYNGTYSVRSLEDSRHGFARASAALALSFVIMQFIAFYTKSNDDFSRVGLTLGTLFAFGFLLFARLFLRQFVRWRCGAHVINELLIDDGGPPIRHRGTMRISAETFDLDPQLDDPHALHRIGLVMRNADRVIISSPPHRRSNWAMILKGANVAGEVVDEAVVELGALDAHVVANQGWLLVSSGPLALRARAAKRFLDLSLAGLAIIALSPVLLCVAVAVKLDDGGPIFFIQRRLGRGNRFFDMFKFRSMAADRGDADGTVSASRSDARITRVGKFMRRTSIDELPQLLNVLRGDMSLVGPRPHAIGSYAGDKLFWEVDPRYWHRHALKPGITGLAQIRGWRGATDKESDLQGRLDADLEYMKGWTLWRDLWILIATARVVVHERAY